MNVPKISVIIPVYNTEHYVRETIESICNQTIKDIEIILIDDGSDDNSMAVLTELAQTDKRIRLHSHKNQGPSITRNKGMDMATGKYIYFMDSDDLLEETTLELCLYKCEEKQLDFVFFDGESFYDDNLSNAPILNYHHTHQLEDKIYNGLEIFNVLLDKGQYTPSVCLNLINRHFLEKNLLRFYPHILHEDQLFSCLMYIHAERVGFIPRSFFHRRLHFDSIMTSHFAWKNMKSYFIVADELIHFSNKSSTAIKNGIRKLLNQMLNAAIWQAHRLSIKERIKVFNTCLWKYSKYISTRTLVVLMLKKKNIKIK